MLPISVEFPLINITFSTKLGQTNFQNDPAWYLFLHGSLILSHVLDTLDYAAQQRIYATIQFSDTFMRLYNFPGPLISIH